LPPNSRAHQISRLRLNPLKKKRQRLKRNFGTSMAKMQTLRESLIKSIALIRGTRCHSRQLPKGKLGLRV
jgi:hypothetical protein